MLYCKKGGDFVKKTALITGATSGIGKAYAKAYAKRGYNLILTGRRQALIEAFAIKLRKLYPVKVTVCLVDFTDDQAYERFMTYMNRQLPIQVLINNAGYGLEEAFTQGTFENQLNMVKVHIDASIQLCTVALKLF